MYIVVFINLIACLNSPQNEESKLILKGKKAVLLNLPDPENTHMLNVVKQYETFISSKIKEFQLPGVAYAIVKNGEIKSIKTYGHRKNGSLDSINKHTVFRLASISKGFSSVLAGLLVDKGYIGWNDKIKDHLPHFRLKKSSNTEKLTLRHTLSQTSGLIKYAGSSLIYQGLSYPNILRKMCNVNIETEPATVYAYQNAMFSVISEVAKSATKYTFEQLLDSLLFVPLGMTDASVGYNAMVNTKNKGFPHVLSRKKWKSANIRKNWYNVAPAAGINASISDMAIWLKTMLGHKTDIVPQKVLDEIFTPHIPMNEDSDYYEIWFPGLSQASYGMGWRIFDYNNHKIVYHGGFVRGFRPEMGFCPKEDVGIVFLTNSSKNELSTNCVRAFFDLYFAPRLSL